LPPETPYASLIFLSYNRPQFLFEGIRDAVAKAGYPCEVIVHDDGSTAEGVQIGLLDMLAGAQISRLILNPPGQNEGVGAAINRGFHLATGDPILKLDQDLLYTDDWLARVVGILGQDRNVGMLGLFKYDHEPVRWQDKQINVPTKGGYHYTRQFCGSGFAIPRLRYLELGPFGEHSDAFCEDSEYMAHVRKHNYELALPDVDLVTNRGFGIGPFTVVEEGMKVHKIHHEPVVFPWTAEYEYEVVEVSMPPEWHELEAAVKESEKRREFDVGVVITTCAGREENLQRTIAALQETRDYKAPRAIVVVYDGCEPMGFDTPIPVHEVRIPKHGPGQEQPRNVGFRALRELAPDCNYVWFLDGDLIFWPQILASYHAGLLQAAEDRVLIGPYDWLAPGVTETIVTRSARVEQYDPRWASFDAHPPSDVLVGDLGAALACFGGNLVWPVEAFERVGGFHPDLHHGRCEDGELGLRAASAGVPMSFVAHARAWHVWHPRDLPAILEKNRRDVPLINEWHPWVEEKGLIVRQQDGARFNFDCPCGEEVNSLGYWEHTQQHER
jgi:glycosyltransferase involved in cell wall biosynthesis